MNGGAHYEQHADTYETTHGGVLIPTLGLMSLLIIF